jgi:hypothetical protein
MNDVGQPTHWPRLPRPADRMSKPRPTPTSGHNFGHNTQCVQVGPFVREWTRNCGISGGSEAEYLFCDLGPDAGFGPTRMSNGTRAAAGPCCPQGT